MELQGKAAVVTGASRGVGRATALQLSAQGCAVLVNYSVSREQAESVVAEIVQAGGKAIAYQCDVHDDARCKTMIDAAIEAFGRLDVLVNNAGTTRFIPHTDLDAVTDDDWDRILGVNLRGPFNCARAAAPHLKAARSAEIVNVSSIAGVAGIGSSIPYCASKAALNNLTIALARALGPEIRVNAVAPGFIEGEWLKQGFGPRYEKVKDANRKRAVLGEVSQADDVAAAILSLITGSDKITAQVIVHDAGFLIGPRL